MLSLAEHARPPTTPKGETELVDTSPLIYIEDKLGLPVTKHAFIALLATTIAAQALPADLLVSVENVGSDNGNVIVAVSSDVDGFPKNAFAKKTVSASARDATGRVQTVFQGLPEQNYAVIAFHDADSNGTLNTNVIGIPVEAYGFSGNGKTKRGPPSFKDAAIPVAGNSTSVSIRLR
jgi:uncharacterized protein (DUF2141 family)